MIYHNDPFLRARKRLALHVDLKKSFNTGGKPGSPPTSTEVIATREAAEGVQEEAEEEGEAPVRKSKRLARGKAKFVVPASPKRKDLPKLDEVPRKRRKFLDVSTTAAVKVNLPQPSVAKLVTPAVTDVTEAQLALSAPEPVMEEDPLAVQEAPLEMLEAHSPTLMIQGVLDELDPTGYARG